MANQKRFLARNGLDNNQQTLTGVADPVNPSDAATKSFASDAANLTTGTLPTARLPAFSGGDVTAPAGSSTLTLANSGATAGTYKSVTVDAKGRVTAGTNPTTLAGYGITDAQPLDSDLTAIAGLVANGLVTKTAAGTAAARSIAVSGTGLSVTNADGVAGNPTVTSNATSANTVSTIVARDASGNFSAGTVTAALSGNASTATKLQTARTLSVSGDATGSASFDGSANAAIAVTLANSGVTAGTYRSVTVDAKGRVTAGTNPTTLAGYGITDAVASSTLGAANGVATLDASGLVPASQLPSYVDDVLEYANFAALPATGESGKIYVTQDTNKIYRWSGSAYIEISPVAGNSDTATKLATARTIAASGDASWSVSFDGSGDVTAALTLANSGATAGTYRSVTVDAKGRVTAGTNPTTLSGYGITDAAPSSHVGATGTAHGAATTSVAGFMSAADKTKLDGVATGANNYVHPTTDGSLHVPATGTTNSGKALVAGATAGSFAWTTLDLSYLPDASVKKSVRAATTANITLSATQTIDGIALAVGDRVLVKDQTTTAQNGIYVVQAAAWTRPADADASSKMAGAAVNVDSGTANGGLRFDTDFKTTDTIGTTAMTWSRVVDTGLASSVTGAAPGTAAVGTSLSYARADHVHPLQTTVSGNAGTATTLQTARTINGVSFNGSANIEVGDLRGSNYISTGAEKPNNAVFGSGKFRYQMLSSSNLGAGTVGTWNDVLWVSSYTGADVKGSNALIMSKEQDWIGFARQAYDSAAWGTVRTILHSGNYNSYAPTLTGTGASGTWGISVTGNAATASAVGWAGVTGKPTTLSGYGITDAVASSSYTAADVLTKLLTVDGTGSGLDADTVDGVQAANLARVTAAGLLAPASGNLVLDCRDGAI